MPAMFVKVILSLLVLNALVATAIVPRAIPIRASRDAVHDAAHDAVHSRVQSAGVKGERFSRHDRAAANPLLDPRVFSFYFYLDVYPDLTTAGITTQQAAEAHWLEHGISEGRWGCGAFSAPQYLARYPNLKTKYGANYTAAILDYVTVGQQEGNVGYIEGGSGGRYTVSAPWSGGHRLFVSTSDRMAGAIDSVQWNGFEFVNQWDHGRELQMAVTTEHGECYNPTEAGNRDDLRQTTTTSVVNYIRADNTTLSTSVQPAFWMQPGEAHANPTASCNHAINKVKVSNYTMTKVVSLGNGLGIPNALEYKAQILIPETQAGVQIEGPTGYMTQQFSTFYTWNATTGALNSVPAGTAHQASTLPYVFATSDGSHAMGALPATVPQRGYAMYNFANIGIASQDTTKWTIVFYYTNVSANTVLPLDTYICIGTLDDVTTCLAGLAKKLGQVTA